MLANVLTPGYLDQQIAIAQQSFDLMAGMRVFPSPASPSVFVAGAVIAGTIRYLGTFEGSLTIECEPAIAFTFTERAMCTARPKLFTDDVRDAIGELINTIAGTLKSLMPAGTRVDMPQVAAHPSAGNIEAALSSLAFDSEFGRFRLVLHEGPRS